MKPRYSLAALLWTISLLCVALAIIVPVMRDFRRCQSQAFAADALTNIGVASTLDDPPPTLRGKLYSLLGVDMRPVASIDFYMSKMQRKDLATLSLIEDCFALKFVDCGRSPIDDDALELISRAPALEAINLADTCISEKGIQALARCRNLVELNISSVGQCGMNAALGGASESGSAGVCSLASNDKLVAGLSATSALKYLRVARSNISDDGAASIATIRTLEGLDCSDNNLSDAALAKLAKLTRLKSLILARNPIDGNGLQRLAKLRYLKQLDLSCDSYRHDDQWDEHPEERPPLDISGLAGMSSLEHLDLTCRSLESKSWPALGSLVGLSRLELHYSNADDETLRSLQGLPRLSDLDISSTEITNEGLKYCRSLPALTDIFLCRTRIGDDGIDYLKDVATLETIYLRFTNVSVNGLLKLDGHPALKEVFVDKALFEEAKTAIESAKLSFKVMR